MKYSLRSRAVIAACASIVGGIAGYLLVLPNVAFAGAFVGAVVAVAAVEIAIRYPKSIQFSIRELLLVTVIVALVLGWWVDHEWMRNRFNLMRQDALEMRELYYSLRNSQAPAPNPPKD